MNQRLLWHQAHSQSILEGFHDWIEKQFDRCFVIPNSRLGQALQYILNHWPELTKFLKIAGVELDNNQTERIIKTPKRLLKTAGFYQTEHGAYIGDIVMSLTATCITSNVNPLDYLTILQQYRSQVHQNPNQWLPWNYHLSLKKLTSEEGGNSSLGG